MSKILLENICAICIGDYLFKGECIELHEIAEIEGSKRYVCKHIQMSAMNI